MKLFNLIYLLLFLLIVSCKKDNQRKDSHCSQKRATYISAEISNFKFKQGTYWVFIDSISLTIDTMRIVSASGNIIPYQYCKDNYHEFYCFTVNPKDIFSTGDQYSLEGNRLMLNQRNEEGSSEEIYLGGQPKIDSLFIYDRYYKSVEGYFKNSNLSENGNKTAYFINTDFGFLKKEVYNSYNQLVSKKLLKDKFIVR